MPGSNRKNYLSFFADFSWLHELHFWKNDKAWKGTLQFREPKQMKEFTVEVFSDRDHEDLVAEIYYDGEYVCMVSQESGFGTLDLEISMRECDESWLFKFDDFLSALSKAKQRLWELRRNS